MRPDRWWGAMGVGVGLALAGVAFAQTFTASVTGTVVDAAGAVLPGVRITVTEVATGQSVSTTTDVEGRYVVPLLKPGVYKVVAEREGFKRFTREGVILQVDQRVRVDIVLEPGPVVEVTEVRAAAPLVERDSASLGQVIENRHLLDLPLNGRNPFALAGLAAGVVPLGSFGVGLTGARGALIAAASNNFSANGGISATNEMLIDGVPAVVCCQGQPAFIPAIDATQEFKVQTNIPQAEFGRTSGGILNIVTKSGTNEVHGVVYEFLRNKSLDANTFFANRAGRQLPPFTFNQFGFALGGPILKNRTFFFGSYEGVRVRRGVTALFTVPTAKMRQGDFSELLPGTVIYDPATTRRVDPNDPTKGFIRDPFPGNLIPSSRFDPVAVNVLRLIPLPNLPGLVNNFIGQGSQQDDDDQFSVRIDHAVGERQRFFARFSSMRNDHVEPNFWGTIATPNGFTQDIHGRNLVISDVITLRPTLLVDVRYGVARQRNFRDPFSAGIDLTTLGFPAAYARSVQFSWIPQLNIVGYSAPQETGNQRFARETHAIQASVTHLRGPHTLKVGVDGRVFRDHNASGFNSAGTFTFTRSFTGGPDPTRPGGGDSLASFLLGHPASGLVNKTQAWSTQVGYVAGYLQDEWKVTRRLTLALGVRYDVETGQTERYDRLSFFDPAAPSPLAERLSGVRGAVRFVGAEGRSRRRWKTDANNVAPRIGFAYSLTEAFVLRGGYGVFFLPTTQRGFGVGNPGFSIDTPFLATVDGVTPIGRLSNPFPEGISEPLGARLGGWANVGTGVAALLFETAIGYVQQWNLSFQYEALGDLLFELAYAGNKGTGLPINQELNALDIEDPAIRARGVAGLLEAVPNPFFGLIRTGPLSTPTVARHLLLRRFPQFTSVLAQHMDAGVNTYHALQARVQKRMSQGVSFLATYTVAKNIGTVSNLTTAFIDGIVTDYQNNFNLRAERSLVPFDIPQRFVFTLSWELPFGRGRAIGSNVGEVLNQVIGGWQVNAILTFQSGLPLAVGVTGAPIFAGSRPNSTGKSARLKGPIHRRLGDRVEGDRVVNPYFDIAAFTMPASLTYGNVGRVLPDVRRPGFRNVDLSVLKMFSIAERIRLQFRAEAFNFTNTPQFGPPGTTLGTRTFGVISSQANTPRQVQLAVKLSF